MSLNIVVTGYYYENNLGDDLFLELAQKIFTEKRFNKNKIEIERIQFVKIDLLITNEVKGKCDKLILFGGETLNDYFLNKIIEFKKHHYCNVYGIGVSCNQNYNEIENKINIFDYLIFRNKQDYNYFNQRIINHCLYVPDIVFMLKYSYPLISFKSNNVGIFPAIPMYFSLNENEKRSYLKSIKQIIDFWLEKKYTIHFFPMSICPKTNENDLYLIKKIYTMYTKSEQQKLIVYETNKDIIQKIHLMKYNICWRFHSAILSIIYRIPFITLSETPKIINLLKDNEIEKFGYNFSNVIDGLKYLYDNRKLIIESLNKIYKTNNLLVKNYKKLDYIHIKRTEPPFYIDNRDIYKLVDHYQTYYKKHSSKTKDSYDFNANLILFLLNRTINSEAHYGLKNKLYRGIDNLQADLKWLINENMKDNNILFYYAANDILKKIPRTINIKKNKLNMNFISQYDMKGLHRSGWQYVLENIYFMQDINGIMCDFYLDRTFHWNSTTFTKLHVIPYRIPWIGFIHHTTDETYSDYNTVNLFKNKLFLDSLKYCVGLILLTEYLKNNVESLLYKLKINIPLFVLTHPTEIVDESKLFTLHNFKLNDEKKIIQVGAWMRDISAIFNLELNSNDCKLKKAALIGKKMEGYYGYFYNDDNVSTTDSDIHTNIINETNLNVISRDNQIRIYKSNKNVEKISHLNDNQFDELLSKNIVFIKLIDASAINTLIECIVRNTPIVINKIKPVVEALGEDYPLYYNEISEVDDLLTMKNIDKTTTYLRRMDKTKYKIEYFINEFQNIISKLKY